VKFLLDDERRKKLLSLIIDFIHVSARKHIDCKGQSEDYIKGYQSCLEDIRVLILMEDDL
jgi:hypothetical protein